jgi:hypothetical protein
MTGSWVMYRLRLDTKGTCQAESAEHTTAPDESSTPVDVASACSSQWIIMNFQ